MAVQVDAAILSPLPLEFFDRDADTVARALIGTFLFTYDRDGNHTGGKIVETEAYDQSDLAAHCFSGYGREAPDSSKAMLFEGGHAYLYYTSSLLCLNFVCDRAGFGSAVLIRALEPTVSSIPKMMERRGPYGPKNLTEKRLCNGPGVLCEALAVCDSYYKRSFSKLSLFSPPFDLRLGLESEAHSIACGPRIGIKKMLERNYPDLIASNPSELNIAIERERRWGIKGSPFLSKPI
ncbi:MAG: DNA-3-methyladenine glycosylase [Xanthobacteraceae bacterium]|nr:DNA-3-methyladenine glycosylase [Xanthobacteraceae bacterium]